MRSPSLRALPRRRRAGAARRPAGAFVGSAGGAACGDLVRISLRAADGSIAAATLRRRGLRGGRSPPARRPPSWPRASRCSTRPRIGADDDRAGARRARPAGRPRRRPRRRRAAPRARRRRAARPRLAPAAGERRAGPRRAQRRRRQRRRGAARARARGRGRRRDAEALGRPATDGERSCCSPEAVLGARALAHALGHPAPDARPRGRVSRARSSATSSPARAGRTPNPCVRCNGQVRFDAMLALADRLGARALATGHYARIADDGEGPLLARAADPAKDQTYMLSGPAPASRSARLRFPLGDLTKPEVREIARRGRACRSPTSARARTSASSPARASARFLARHGGLGDRPGESSTPPGRCSARTAATTASRSASAGASASRRGEPLYVLSTDARDQPRRRRPARAARDRRPCALRGAVLHRAGGRVDRVKLRYRSRPLACAWRAVAGGRARRARARARRARVRRRARPDRLPHGRRPVVGGATIA